MGLLLALDLGTTSTRALVIDDEVVCGRSASPLEVHFPEPGRVEQDPEQWVEASVGAIRAALAQAGRAASDVAALGIASQRSTTLAWDASTGRALGPAIGWQDQRTRERVAELNARDIPITTLPSATKFEWWLRHDATIADAARRGTLRLGTPDAWLTFRLSGGAAHVTEPGQASCTALYDYTHGDWSDPALALFGIDERWLPEIVATDAVVAQTSRSLLGAAIPLAARAGDQQAATFAQGVHSAGQAKLTLGTAAMLDLHTGAAPAAPPRGAYPLALWRLEGSKDEFCLEGSVLSAGAAVEWLVDLGLLPDAASLDASAASVASAEGVAFVPALQGLGTPYLDDGARGLIGGLTRGSTAAHVAAALIDGLAHRCVDLCDAFQLDPRPLRVDGGLSRSDLLLQRLADHAGRSIVRGFETEATAVGVARLAGRAVGGAGDVQTSRAQPEASTRFEPRSSQAERDGARERWRAILVRVSDAPGHEPAGP